VKKLVLAACLFLTGCATASRDTYPIRSATEEMLISEAAEDAARQIIITIPKGRRCYLDTTNFEGLDGRYAVSAVRQKLLEQGIALMETRLEADTIIEIRTGVLSIDSIGKSIMIPAIPIGQIIPQITTPLSYNQWSRRRDEGIAKISAFAYDKKTGTLLSVAESVIGRSHRRRINGQQVVVSKQAN
jgi:hypothetical protein